MGASYFHMNLHKTSWDPILNIGLIELAAILKMAFRDQISSGQISGSV